MLGWREVPVNEGACGTRRARVAPRIAQLFVGAGDDIADQDALERKLYVIRRAVEQRGPRGARDPELLEPHARAEGDAHGPAAAALLPRPARRARGRAGSRSCTRASPRTPSRAGSSRTRTGCSPTTARSTRCAATATGCARASCQLASPLFGDDIEKIRPLLRDDISDSASLDGLMELLVLGGRSPAHAISMLIPEALPGPARAARRTCATSTPTTPRWSSRGTAPPPWPSATAA